MLEIMLKAMKEDRELAGMGIYHQASPHGCRFPNIVYNIISDVPALHADNEEIQSRMTVRIHIATKAGGHAGIYRRVNKIMSGLGFMRVQTVEFLEDGLKVLAVDYRIGVDS